MSVARRIVMSILAGSVLAVTCSGCLAKPAARFEWEASGGAGHLMDYVATVAVAPDGLVWVADASGRFFIFDANGRFIETWGEPGTDPGQFRFLAPETPGGSVYGKYQARAGLLFLADGSFYVMEPVNNRIQHFSADRRFLRAWGSGNGSIAEPIGMSLRGAGELLVGFQRNRAVQRFSLDGDFLGTIDLGLDQPTSSIAVDADGAIYVGTKFPPQDNVPPRGRILVFEPDGKPRRVIGLSEPGFAGLSFNTYLGVDAQGRCFAADEWNQHVVVFGRDGTRLFFWGGSGTGAGKLDHPDGIAFGASGSVYVADQRNKRIQKFTITGL